ncbi:MAG: hypothetical protein JW983_09175 [Elusimicrobia bacterium]|nr:hypothetical protein [Elusimicrobiota bacterium]
MKYVGLTNDPQARKQFHGNPVDWWQIDFSSEKEARTWKKTMAEKPEYVDGPDDGGWKFGYTYTIVITTRQQ